MGRLGKVLKALQALFYITVAAGIAFFLVDLYLSQSGWSVSIAAPPRVQPLGTSLEITIPLTVYNPSSSKVVAKLVWYTVNMGSEPIGQGLIPYLVLEPGDNRVDLTLRVDIIHLPCAAVEALSKSKEIELNVQGYAVFTIMLFGRFGYRDVTIPFNTTVYKIAVSLDPATRGALKVAALLCSAGAGHLPIPLP